MGVEEIQKINALARELMRHNIAATSDEALLKAEEMLRGNGVNSMTAAITSNTSIGKSEYHASNEAISSLNMDVRSLGVRFDAMAREILSLKDEVRKFNEGLGDVNRQVNRLSVQQPVQAHAAFAAAKEEVQAPVQSFAREAVQAPAPQPQQQKMINVKTGKAEFQPEDVAIEKIFYFGK
ncbi:hypothetical protein HYU18_00215 [Candidatus Woesearchaeota archaeon]|nr:hypothetical protein [Candidatus Woesearchaeota archaeon]